MKNYFNNLLSNKDKYIPFLLTCSIILTLVIFGIWGVILSFIAILIISKLSPGFKSTFPTTLNYYYSSLKKLTIYFIVGTVVISSAGLLTRSSYEVTVAKTESKVMSNGKSMYMVYTNKGTFKCVDSAFDLKFNSSDMYARLVPTKTYIIKTSGIRNNFLSMYPNIIEVQYITD